MRGTDTKQGTMLNSFGNARAEGAAEPSAASGEEARGCCAGGAVADVQGDVQRGRPAVVPPERLLKASLLMALYTVRSERLFCEQLDYNLLFRWFLDMNMDEEAWPRLLDVAWISPRACLALSDDSGTGRTRLAILGYGTTRSGASSTRSARAMEPAPVLRTTPRAPITLTR